MAWKKKSVAAIGRELQEAGYRTHTGNTRWSNSHIVKILKNEKYVGDLVQKKTFTPDYLTHARRYNHGEEALVALRNHHEPIVERRLWDIAQAELKRRNRNGEPGAGHSNRYLFSGKIKCGECGASFVCRKKKRADGSSCKRWSCYTAVTEGRRRPDARGGERGCGVGQTLRDGLALELLKQSLRSIPFDREQLIDHVTDLAVEAVRLEEGESVARKLERETGRLARKRADILDAFFSGTITREDMALLTERCQREQEALQSRLAAIRARACAAGGTAAREDIRQRVAAIVAGSIDSEVLYKNILDRMVVYKDHRVEVRLHNLPQKWIYVLEQAHFNTAVPISVSSPFSSG